MSEDVAEETAAAAPIKVTADQLGIVAAPQHEGQVDIDLGHLTVYDPTPVNPADYTISERSSKCLEVTTSLTQLLVNQLFALPAEAVTGGRLAHLPAPTTPLPREKPIPKAKPLTKWQKFAQEKGIRKRKRSKLVWDEDTGEWRRRHGYKRANDDEAIPIIEASADDKPGEDPFTRLRQEKRQRIKEQSGRQLANAKLAAKAGALPATLRLAANLPEKGKGKHHKRKDLKGEIKGASLQAGVSTASMGKCDKRLPGEKEGERRLPGKRKKVFSVTDTAAERAAITNMADRMIREKADDVLDLSRALGKFEANERQQRHVAKQAGGSSGNSSGGKGSRGGGGKRGGSSSGGRGGGRGGGSGGRGGGRGGSSGGGGRGGRKGSGSQLGPKGGVAKRQGGSGSSRGRGKKR